MNQARCQACGSVFPGDTESLCWSKHKGQPAHGWDTLAFITGRGGNGPGGAILTCLLLCPDCYHTAAHWALGMLSTEANQKIITDLRKRAEKRDARPALAVGAPSP